MSRKFDEMSSGPRDVQHPTKRRRTSSCEDCRALECTGCASITMLANTAAAAAAAAANTTAAATTMTAAISMATATTITTTVADEPALFVSPAQQEASLRKNALAWLTAEHASLPWGSGVAPPPWFLPDRHNRRPAAYTKDWVTGAMRSRTKTDEMVDGMSAAKRREWIANQRGRRDSDSDSVSESESDEDSDDGSDDDSDEDVDSSHGSGTPGLTDDDGEDEYDGESESPPPSPKTP
ncbi:hypothetical protein B0T24DRAFT_80988 [Lasiosphaeria ovina]|uniref:Uncharacterized protein n=1 Tax=Lasiosphaeria ovina TaxID=92902 RepID=A0AAE0NMP2_9PEZI|nr:hypothetical protein B0T24DRAFT_80988 [Lasiosphaeria ovina]